MTWRRPSRCDGVLCWLFSCSKYTRIPMARDKHGRDMNAMEQQVEFLGWKVVPARLDATKTAWFLGFEPHEIPILITDGLLKPLGHPPRNGTKFFATASLEELRRDEKWLARASDAICAYWRERNARKRNRPFSQPLRPSERKAVPVTKVAAVQ